MNTKWIQIDAEDLAVELRQLADEGITGGGLIEEMTSAVQEAQEAQEAAGDPRRIAELLDAAEDLAPEVDYPYREPSGLEGIIAARAEVPGYALSSLGRKDLAARIRGAWIGRCAGCLLGKPVEGWRTERLWGYLKATGNYPLRTYIRGDVSEDLKTTYKIAEGAPFIDRVNDGMPEDDDTNYTALNLALVKEHGAGFSANDVGRLWMGRLPILHTYTAERIAYRNLVEGFDPPQSARRRNPCREWIGAQIRADAFGYLNVGNLERAAAWAHRDASVSHVKNGIYGEMWVAAMLAAAPFESDAAMLIAAGLSVVPAKSRLAAAIRDVLGWRKSGRPYDDVVAQIHRTWDEHSGHHWCHTISNAQIVAIGLLWGEGEFGRSVCRAVEPGFDTDCNGATVGSIFGMMHGAEAIPLEWSEPLADTLHTGVAGYHRVAISAMAAETHELLESLS